MLTRFKRTQKTAGGSQLFQRDELNSQLGEALDSGAFLARLWARFGEARPSEGGFTYDLEDAETGLVFRAYSGASGPSYGGDDRNREAYRPVLEAFERLLESTTPVDCTISFKAEVDYGGGTMEIGFANGRSFARSIRTGRSPEDADSYEECVALALDRGGAHGPMVGWATCLAEVIPEPDDSDQEWIGFTLDKQRPAMLFIGPSGSPEPVPLASIRFDPPLSPTAQLWLDSFSQWKEKRRGKRRS